MEEPKVPFLVAGGRGSGVYPCPDSAGHKKLPSSARSVAQLGQAKISDQGPNEDCPLFQKIVLSWDMLLQHQGSG